MTSEAFYEVINYLPYGIRAGLKNLPSDIAAKVNEIRLRAGKPVALICRNSTLFPDKFGTCHNAPNQHSAVATPNQLEETLILLCGGSVYCHQEEIAQGFIALRGGHRAGLCGSGVIADGQLKNIRDISSVNIRIAGQIKGCSALIDRRHLRGGLLLAGPPGCGKTTMLRDIVRRCSSGEFGEFLRVAVADERGEISAMWGGEPQMDIGFADVLCGIEKTKAVMMAVRTLNPQVVAFDEIGSEADVLAIQKATSSGVECVATLHAADRDELRNNIWFRKIATFMANVAVLDKSAGGETAICKTKEILNAHFGNLDALAFGFSGRNNEISGTSQKAAANRNIDLLP